MISNLLVRITSYISVSYQVPCRQCFGQSECPSMMMSWGSSFIFINQQFLQFISKFHWRMDPCIYLKFYMDIVYLD
jgi:hypothetical protein